MGNIFFRDSVLNDTYGGRDLLKLGKTAQSVAEQVRNNDFSDLYIGDYFATNIDNRKINWYIADFNYFLKAGDVPFKKPHLVLINGAPIATQRMNPTNTTEGGYVNSEMRKTTFNTYLNYLKNTILGDYILTHRELLTSAILYNSISAGCPFWYGCASDWEWHDSTIELLTESQLYGKTTFSSSAYDTGIGHTQFALFRLDREFINLTGIPFWLRNIASNSLFCTAIDSRSSGAHSASLANGVRIYFCFG